VMAVLNFAIGMSPGEQINYVRGLVGM
jgi:hypothetical protein